MSTELAVWTVQVVLLRILWLPILSGELPILSGELPILSGELPIHPLWRTAHPLWRTAHPLWRTACTAASSKMEAGSAFEEIDAELR